MENSTFEAKTSSSWNKAANLQLKFLFSLERFELKTQCRHLNPHCSRWRENQLLTQNSLFGWNAVESMERLFENENLK